MRQFTSQWLPTHISVGPEWPLLSLPVHVVMSLVLICIGWQNPSGIVVYVAALLIVFCQYMYWTMVLHLPPGERWTTVTGT